MDIAIKSVYQVSVVEVSGSIDGKTAPNFQQEILQVIEEVDTILIDLDKVTFMSSAGLRVMLVTHRAAQGGKIVALTGLPEEIEDNMEATGFLAFFKVFDTLEAGLEALK